MNGKASKDKGSRAEREVVKRLEELTGCTIRRTLAGHAQDIGDLHGLTATTVEVKDRKTIAVGVNEGLAELTVEQANAGTPFAVCFVRRPGGRWFACMTPEQFVDLWREATS